jgi:hypothetical protein
MSSFDRIDSNVLKATLKSFDESLKDLNISGKDAKKFETPILDPETLIKLMEKPSAFTFNDDGELLFVVDGENSLVNVNPMSESYIKTTTKISSMIPDCPFDTECGGIKEMQIEAMSIYKVLVVNAMLQNSYRSEIDEILESYDYENLRASNLGDRAFTLLLRKIQESSRRVTKFVIQCLNLKFEAFKAKKDSTYNGIVSVADATSLESLIRSVSVIDYNCNEELKNAKTKRERLNLIDKKEKERRKIIKDSGDRTALLYAIYSLNTEQIPELIHRKIQKLSREVIFKLQTDGTITDFEVAKDFEKKLVRRGLRQHLREMKISRYIKFSNGVYEGLIPAL